MKQVRLYIEGAPELREGFRGFLQALQHEARKQRRGWTIVMCGSRSNAYEAFQLALETHGNALNILLVDAERPVSGTARQHLSSPDGDNWGLTDAADEQCHLMAQAMEAWMVADPKALIEYYGKELTVSALPRNPKVEQIPKADLAVSLENATRNTRKGKYHKTRHAPEILARLDSYVVSDRAPHCKRLFDVIERYLTEP